MRPEVGSDKTWDSHLFTYFASGWAFLLPYLFGYLVFACCGLPSQGKPGLIQVFQTLHVAHAALASWATAARLRATAGRRKELGLRLLAWLFLAALLVLPGAYLEWPADSWEHLRRIREWDQAFPVGEQSSGYKAFYAFIASLVPGGANTRLLGLYVGGVGTLLAWQYYRLARCLGLSHGFAFSAVLLVVLTSGSSVFGFVRYYGLSTSVFAQIGAVAMIRLVAETALGPSGGRSWRGGVSFGLLALLVGFNHLQGLGIAVLGVASAGVCLLLQWRRQAGWWILGGVALASVLTVAIWPRIPLVEAYRDAGWLSHWYAFNLVDWPSPATSRAIQILGAFGVVNLACGAVLLRSNRLAAWLTVGPVLWLLTPVVALPFASVLAAKSAEEIVTFHRMLLAIPSGFALTVLAQEIARAAPRFMAPRLGALAVLLIPAAAVIASPGGLTLNRWWHNVYIAPSDLELRPAWDGAQGGPLPRSPEMEAAPLAVSIVLAAATPGARQPRGERIIGGAVAGDLAALTAIGKWFGPMPDGQMADLWSDPYARRPASWMTYAGVSPRFDQPAGDGTMPAVLVSQPGQTSEILTGELIALAPGQSYQLEMSVRQIGPVPARALLGVAWYDRSGSLLPAFAPGGAEPSGWRNGTFSYFQDLPALPRGVWHTYRVSFGGSERRAVPEGARYLRLALLLNTEPHEGAVLQAAGIRLWPKSRDPGAPPDGTFPQALRPGLKAVPANELFSPCSAAARLSRHWPPNQVATDLAGFPELQAAFSAKPPPGGRP